MNTKLAIILCFLIFPIPAISDSNNVLTIGGINMELGMKKVPLLEKFTGRYQLAELDAFPGVVSIIDRDEGDLIGRLWFKEGSLTSAAKNIAYVGGVEAVKFGDRLFETIRNALEGSPGKAAFVAIHSERSEGYTTDEIQLLIDNKLIVIKTERLEDQEIYGITLEEMLVDNPRSTK